MFRLERSCVPQAQPAQFRHDSLEQQPQAGPRQHELGITIDPSIFMFGIPRLAGEKVIKW